MSSRPAIARSVVVLPSGGAEQHEELPVPDLQVELADDVVVAEVFLDVFEDDASHLQTYIPNHPVTLRLPPLLKKVGRKKYTFRRAVTRPPAAA